MMSKQTNNNNNRNIANSASFLTFVTSCIMFINQDKAKLDNKKIS